MQNRKWTKSYAKTKIIIWCSLTFWPWQFGPSVVKLHFYGSNWAVLCKLKPLSHCMCLINQVQSNLSQKTHTPPPCAWWLAAPAPRTSRPLWWMSSAHAMISRYLLIVSNSAHAAAGPCVLPCVCANLAARPPSTELLFLMHTFANSPSNIAWKVNPLFQEDICTIQITA